MTPTAERDALRAENEKLKAEVAQLTRERAGLNDRLLRERMASENARLEAGRRHAATVKELIDIRTAETVRPDTPQSPLEPRTIGEAIVSASDVADETLAIDSNVLVLTAPDRAVRIDLCKIASALRADERRPVFAQPVPAAEGAVRVHRHAPIRVHFILACHASPEPWGIIWERGWNSDAGASTRAWMRREGLVGPDNYELTERGQAWVEAILRTPLPVIQEKTDAE